MLYPCPFLSNMMPLRLPGAPAFPAAGLAARSRRIDAPGGNPVDHSRHPERARGGGTASPRACHRLKRLRLHMGPLTAQTYIKGRRGLLALVTAQSNETEENSHA